MTIFRISVYFVFLDDSTIKLTKDSSSKAKIKTNSSSSSKDLIVSRNVSTSKRPVHNNLLSDLARISQESSSTSKDDSTKPSSNESKPINKTKTGTSGVPSSASLVPKRNDIKGAPNKVVSTEDNSNDDNESVVTETYGHPPSEEENQKTEFKLPQPTHLVLNNSRNDVKPFSKLITSSDNGSPANDEQSNDEVTKTQELSPLISDRSETPSNDIVSNTRQQNVYEAKPSNGIVNDAGQQNVYETKPSNGIVNDAGQQNVYEAKPSNDIVSNAGQQNVNQAKPTETKKDDNVNANANAATNNGEKIIDEISSIGGDNNKVNFKDITGEYNETTTNYDKSIGKKGMFLLA